VTNESQVVAERRGGAGFILLNRPRALNALNLDMVRAISAALDDFEADECVKRVVLHAAGDRAFCAGGDVRWVAERGRAGDLAGAQAFFRAEYVLNARIHAFPKPYVSLIDGIVMGGGVGLSLHGAHRVVSERAVFAMPEIGIGFFPDVGATYALPRLPHRFGVALAATGLRANAGDMAAFGLATAFVESARLPALAEALTRPGDTAAIIGEFSSPAPPSPLSAETALFDRDFAQAEPDSVLEALRATPTPFSEKLLGQILAGSPTSFKVALRQMKLGADLSFAESMRTEFRIVTRILQGHDFYEGVRAALVDRDNRPQWRPSPSSAELDAYFAPLGRDELILEGDAF
jgi:enoyl-CoA hydratase